MLPRSSTVPVLGSLLPSLSDFQIYSGFGQRSDTKSLAAAVDLDEFLHSPPKPLPTASHDVYQPILHSVPSLTIFNLACGYDEEEVEEKLGGESSERDGCLERSITFADNVIGVGRAFSFGKNTDLIQEGEGAISNELHSFGAIVEAERPKSPPLYMARGLGIDVGFGGGEDGGYMEFCLPEYGERVHEITDMEEYYARMVEENPGRTLFLRNYAEFLYQSKRDLVGAEEYYARAILSEPGDGELLSQYAKIVWELDHDHGRASTYFETAVQVAPKNWFVGSFTLGECTDFYVTLQKFPLSFHFSHVNAAYASFLWETEDEEEENSFQEGLSANSLRQTKAMTSASA